MTTLSFSPEIKASFAELKKTARGDDDIVAWFQAHPSVLPNLPEMLWPYLEINKPGHALVMTKDEKAIAKAFTLSYSAVMPHEPVTAFKDLVGVLTCDKEDQRPTEAGGYMSFHMDMREWPFVAARVALNLLKDPAGIEKHFSGNWDSVWAISMPSIKWDQLTEFYSAGLLPDDVSDFTHWLCNYTPGGQQFTTMTAPQGALPDDLSV